jgi:PrgI family protein
MPRIPADVERPDRIAFNLTAPQLVILATTGLVAWLLATAAQLLVPPVVADALALPLVAVGAALALGQRDGLGLDQLALAALRHVRTARYQVPAPEGVPAPPGLLAGIPTGSPPGPLTLPTQGIDPDGLVDLGGDGMALVCQASTVNFALRTPAEQEALVAAFARVLHALTGPVQLVVRTERVDLGRLVRDLDERAGGLPHPALEQCARDHARFLGELARRRDVLRRTWLLVFRDPTRPDAGVRLARRAEQAAALLQAAGVQLAPLDHPAAHAAVGRAVDPDSPQPPGGLARPDQAVTRTPRRPRC